MDWEDLQPVERARLTPHRPILIAYRGSISHGTYVPPDNPNGIDDVDIICCYIPGIEHYFGFPSVPSGKDIKLGKWDSAAYEFRHFCQLLSNGNPNVLSTLWIDPKHILEISPEGKLLMENKNLFLSKRAYHSFGGYAHAQLKRMTSFKDVTSACGCQGKFHASTCAENLTKGRGSQKRFATGFMGEKRKSLVAKFGYDVKNAAHLIRLLRMGTELFLHGTLEPDRTKAGDAQQLISIKQGKWRLDQVQTEAQILFQEMEAAAAESTLPEEPREKEIEQLMVKILSMAHAGTIVRTKHILDCEALKCLQS